MRHHPSLLLIGGVAAQGCVAMALSLRIYAADAPASSVAFATRLWAQVLPNHPLGATDPTNFPVAPDYRLPPLDLGVRHLGASSEFIGVEGAHLSVFRAGWPCYSLYGYEVEDAPYPPDTFGLLTGRVPVAPLWLGLAVNSALYATAAYALLALAAGFRRRWRRRQSRCPACGHSLVDSVLCPECGTPARQAA